MPYHKPKGRELKVAKVVSRLISKLYKMVTEHHPVSMSIHIDFTLEGIRTNGRESVTGLLDVKKDLEEYKTDCENRIKQNQETLKLTETALEKLRWIQICPKCKGEKGFWSKPKRGYMGRTWDDCVDCNGRGIINE